VAEAKDSNAKDRTLGRLQQASELIAADRPELAERMIRSVLETYPNLAVAHALLGKALADLGRGPEAIRAADMATRLEPNLPLAHAARFRALQAIGYPWEAEIEARRAVELQPGEPNRLSDLAEAMFRWGRYNEALEVSSQGLRMDPRHLPCLHVRALTLVFLDRVDEARATLEAALLEAPSMAVLHAAIGRALEQQGELDEARVEYLEALRLDASEVMARHGLRRTSAWYSRLKPHYVYVHARRRLRGQARQSTPDDRRPG
jgi:tetratricopeptide (TPR) repeat protein